MNKPPPEFEKQFREALAREHGNRVSEGMVRRVSEGDLPGCPPVGYRNARFPNEPKIVIDEELAPLVRKAFAMAAEGKLSLRKTLKELTDEGLVSRSGKPMGVSAFWNVLTNPFYTGRIRYWGRLVPGNHEALVSEEIFLEVRDALERNRKRDPY